MIEKSLINTIIFENIEGDMSSLNSDENIEWIKKVIIDEICPETIESQDLNEERADLIKQLKYLKIHKNQLWRVVENGKVQSLQLVVPECDRRKIMELNHSSILSGHFKFEKTIDRIRRRFYWPKMNVEILKFIEECMICQKTSNTKNKPKIPLNPIRPSFPLEIVNTDIKGPLKVSKNGFKYILVVIDHFTKWVVLYALKNIDAKTTAKALFDFICRYGIPDAFLSDQGKNYQAQLIQELWEY